MIFLSTINKKYKEMILDAAEAVLGYFGLDRGAYSNLKMGRRRKKWYEELKHCSPHLRPDF